MGWYVLETNPQAEQALQDRITVLGPPTFLAKERRERPHYLLANRTRPSPFRLLIPRYLFVNLDLPNEKSLISIINRYPGVKSWLGSSPAREFPLAVRQKDFERLQTLAAEKCADVPTDAGPPKPLSKDTVVRILWAPLEGRIASVQIDNGIRADLLLHEAGVLSNVTLPRELIEAVR